MVDLSPTNGAPAAPEAERLEQLVEEAIARDDWLAAEREAERLAYAQFASEEQWRHEREVCEIACAEARDAWLADQQRAHDASARPRRMPGARHARRPACARPRERRARTTRRTRATADASDSGPAPPPRRPAPPLDRGVRTQGHLVQAPRLSPALGDEGATS